MRPGDDGKRSGGGDGKRAGGGASEPQSSFSEFAIHHPARGACALAADDAASAALWASAIEIAIQRGNAADDGADGDGEAEHGACGDDGGDADGADDALGGGGGRSMKRLTADEAERRTAIVRLLEPLSGGANGSSSSSRRAYLNADGASGGGQL